MRIDFNFVTSKRKYENFMKCFVLSLANREDLFTKHSKLTFIKNMKLEAFYSNLCKMNFTFYTNYKDNLEKIAHNIYVNYFENIRNKEVRDSIPDLIYFNLMFSPTVVSKSYIVNYLISKMKGVLKYEFQVEA